MRLGFKEFLKVMLLILAFLLILLGLGLIFHIGELPCNFLFNLFWLVVAFEIGVGFCRYYISDE